MGAGWTVIPSRGDQFEEVASGLTSGGVHNIARAETLAVLKALEAVRCPDIFCDNSGVVQRLSRILSYGFDFVSWRSHPNVDLWSRIAAQVVTRPAGSITITKVKSHQSIPENASAEEKWKAQGNDFADRSAKNAVKTYLDAKVPNYREWKRDEEESAKTLALLHEVLNSRKKQLPQPQADPNEDAPQEDPLVPHAPFYVINEVDVSGNTWDPRWFESFPLLTWPPADQNPPGPMVSLLELMLDCLILYQILPPTTLRVCSKRRISCPFKFLRTVTHAPCFPDITSHACLRFQVLKPVERGCVRLIMFSLFSAFCLSIAATPLTLKFWKYTNVAPLIQIRPVLLCGHSVSNFLEFTIVPGVGSLNFPLHLPRRFPRQLPASFGSNF